MKFITQLHDKHLNKPMWIVGSDPSLDTYPDNFLDDKLGMTLHLAGLKFPNATYRYFNELDRITHLIGVNPAFKDKANIFAFPFYERKERETWPVTGENVHFLLLKPYPPRKIRDDIFNEIGVNAMIEQVGIAREGKTIVFGGFATCLHCGFFTAIMMGCNPINLIGNNHDTMDGKDHFNRVEEVDRKMRPTAPRYNQKRRGEMMRAGTNAIIEGCKRNNIKVNWYKNYEDFKLRNSNQK